MRLVPLVILASLASCSQKQTAPVESVTGVAPSSSSASASAPAPASAPTSAAAALPPGAKACTVVADAGVSRCLRFASAADAFRFILADNPSVLAIGEAHAQKGTESIDSSTKRFTEQLLPIVAPEASDVVVELWAPDPKCQKAVAKVATAQKTVTQTQASTNQNEYVTLGTHARELGMTPWLLRPTCDDFGMLADAGADAVDDMLKLVKRLTEDKVARLYDRNKAGADAGAGAAAAAAKRGMVLAYGGAIHNDLHPEADAKDYAFGPDLDRLTGGRYVELDLIVPEYVKDEPVWRRLPWYAAWKASPAPKGEATLYVLAERSFVLVLPPS